MAVDVQEQALEYANYRKDIPDTHRNVVESPEISACKNIGQTVASALGAMQGDDLGLSAGLGHMFQTMVAVGKTSAMPEPGQSQTQGQSV